MIYIYKDTRKRTRRKKTKKKEVREVWHNPPIQGERNKKKPTKKPNTRLDRRRFCFVPISDGLWAVKMKTKKAVKKKA